MIGCSMLEDTRNKWNLCETRTAEEKVRILQGWIAFHGSAEKEKYESTFLLGFFSFFLFFFEWASQE